MRRISCIGRDDGSGGVYTNTTLHDGGHYTARWRSLHCTTAVTTLHDGGHYTARRGTARSSLDTSTRPIRGGVDYDTNSYGGVSFILFTEVRHDSTSTWVCTLSG